MEDTAIPYELPEVENHSFFFIDQRVETSIEAKLHRHDAWELYYVVHGYGNRMAGDTLQPFAAGDVALIPPSMLHRWEYAPDSADTDGCVRYLMVAFSHSLVERCMEVFPELRNRLAGLIFPTDALKFGTESSRAIRKILTEMNGMDELGRLSAMFRLLPVIFTSSDHTFAGKPMRIERAAAPVPVPLVCRPDRGAGLFSGRARLGRGVHRRRLGAVRAHWGRGAAERALRVRRAAAVYRGTVRTHRRTRRRGRPP